MKKKAVFIISFLLLIAVAVYLFQTKYPTPPSDLSNSEAHIDTGPPPDFVPIEEMGEDQILTSRSINYVKSISPTNELDVIINTLVFSDISFPKKDECYYPESHQAVKDLTLEKYITIPHTLSLKNPALPSYPEGAIIITEIFSNLDENLNEKLLALGAATTTDTSPENYRTIEAQAKANHLGLWGKCL